MLAALLVFTSVAHAGPRERYVASVRLREDPSDAARWVAMGQAVDDPREAEPILEEALRLAPDDPAALIALARVRTALGRGEEAVALLERAGGVEAQVALADALRDPDPARRVLATSPGHAGAALAVARWTEDPGEARAVLASVEQPDPRVLRLQARMALRDGDAEAARQALDPLPPEEAEPLARWVACLESGSVTGETIAELWEARATVLATPGADAAPLATRTACPAALLLAATAGHDPVGTLQTAVVLAPGDSGLQAALGRALLAADRPGEAVSWLRAAAAARPHEPAIDLARALVGSGDEAGARDVLEQAAVRFPDDVDVAAARADLAPDREAELAILVAVVERTWDPKLLERARTLAERLGEEDVLRPERALPPLGDEVSEEIVVVAEGSRERLQRLVSRMSELGYGEPVVRANGDVHFPKGRIAQPAVTLRRDGSFDIQRDGLVLVKKYPWMEDGPYEWRSVSERKLSGYRSRVLEAITPELVAWREAICTEAFEERLIHEIPGTLDQVWRDGIDRDGTPLPEPAARRRALLEWWATRSCNPEGEAVRTLIARYLEHEVQTSPWPVTSSELEDTLARAVCDSDLSLTGLH